jgi:hypothetical protein
LIFKGSALLSAQNWALVLPYFQAIHSLPEDEDFVRLIQGQLNAMSAYTSGKLKVEGDLMKSQLIEKLFKF